MNISYNKHTWQIFKEEQERGPKETIRRNKEGIKRQTKEAKI